MLLGLILGRSRRPLLSWLKQLKKILPEARPYCHFSIGYFTMANKRLWICIMSLCRTHWSLPFNQLGRTCYTPLQEQLCGRDINFKYKCWRSEVHSSDLQSLVHILCLILL